MPTESSRAVAEQLKCSVSTIVEEVPPHTHLWFAEEDAVVPYKAIARHADAKYLEWRTVGNAVRHECDLAAHTNEWLRTVPTDHLASLLDEVPTGLAADPHTGVAVHFTPWQRLSMVLYVERPVDVTSTVTIDVPNLQALARYTQYEPRPRKIPIHAKFNLRKGTVPDVGICDLPTACGKTAWSCTVAALAASSRRFPKLLREFGLRRSGAIVQGDVVPRVARLVLVATAASTFQHFVDTLGRLLPPLREADPATTFVLWHTMSKNYSVQTAAQMPTDTLVFWIVPLTKLNDVLRATPDIAVAFGVTDEFSVDTPRERSRTAKSQVLKQLITQATPQALAKATRGARSWLRDLLGGELIPPNEIRQMVKRRDYVGAHTACQQLCMLDLMTLTTPFRARVRDDLAAMVPATLETYVVRSRRLTFASHLTGAHTDMVPASLANVLVSYLRLYYPTNDSLVALRGAVEERVVSPAELETLVRRVETMNPRLADVTVVDRLVERLREFSSSCPICLTDNPTDPKVFGCCGYCVCADCFDACRGYCAFCRTNLPERADYPPSQFAEEAADPLDTFVRRLRACTSVEARQIVNVTHTVHALVASGRRRLLLVVEKVEWARSSYEYIDASALGRATGVVIERVHVVGKGTDFAHTKRRFDSPDPKPMALLCEGVDPAFLVGTNLDHADALVVVGHIPANILDQAIGRIFRPRPSRDNSRPMVAVQVST